MESVKQEKCAHAIYSIEMNFTFDKLKNKQTNKKNNNNK